MSGGKWDRILTPEEYKPPVTAMFPPRMPSLRQGENRLRVVLWAQEEQLCLDRYSVNPKWFELFNAGEEEIEFEIEAPEGICLSESKGSFRREKRIFVSADGSEAGNTILVRNRQNGECVSIPVCRSDFAVPDDFEGYVEADGYVSIPADGYLCKDGWRIIPWLGRGGGNAAEAEKDGERNIQYSFYLKNGGRFRAEIFRFPTLNSTGKIRAAVRVDDRDAILVESLSNDEWRGSWKKNVMSNVDRLTFELPALEPGGHTLTVTAIDAYFTFSAIAIYTKPQKDSYLAPRTSFYQVTEKEMGKPSAQAQKEEMSKTIPQSQADIRRKITEEQIPQLPEDFYGMTLPPRPTVYAGSKCWINNGLIDSNIRRPLEKYPVRNTEICSKVLQERGGSIRIDAQSALAQDENAYIRGGFWTYADSETGLSMFVREKGLVWNDLTCAPSLNYRIQVAEGGTWHIWGLLKIDEEPAPIAFGLDGKPQPLSEQYNRGDLWCYEAKQIWRWTPVCDMEILAGEHTFSVYAVKSGMRVDRIYLTKGEELPPDALEWGQ